MTRETCLTWLQQKLAAREIVAKGWLKCSVEFNRANAAQIELLKELIAEVETS